MMQPTQLPGTPAASKATADEDTRPRSQRDHARRAEQTSLRTDRVTMRGTGSIYRSWRSDDRYRIGLSTGAH